MRKILVVLFLLASTPTLAEDVGEVRRGSRPGLGITGCFGWVCFPFGFQATYYIPVGAWAGRPIQLAPSFGLGINPLPTRFSPSASLAGIWGVRHRVLVDIGYGMYGHTPIELHGVRVDRLPVYGPRLGAGYEFVGDGGFIFRLVPTLALLGFGRFGLDARALSYSFSLSFGWKPW